MIQSIQLADVDRLEKLVEMMRNGNKIPFVTESAIALARKIAPTEIVNTIFTDPDRALAAGYNLLPGATIVIDGKKGFLGIGAETNVELVHEGHTYRTTLKSRDHAVAIWSAVLRALRVAVIRSMEQEEPQAPVKPPAVKKPRAAKAPKAEAPAAETAEPAPALEADKPAKRTRKDAQRKKPSPAAESGGDTATSSNEGLVGAVDDQKPNTKRVVGEGKTAKAPKERSSSGSLRPVGFKPQAVGRDASTTSGPKAPRLSAKDLSRR
ncbi:hypothetical protein CcrC1_gp344 [Caulobacter phage C1]|nr:hypothetical protein CcrC1_gp344 [Caulobacter phage C1]UTU08573.1 hypothetical protein CcrC2_gp345 [Caulobacter phage C2]UTU09089.1 hypothetical protein CcrJ4_gp340 [Caulobacter phage J4]UTU10206.1 hypothetical protein CcrRB23_gp344 [Caulobacter phage RB23]WGN97240.1 hypothetical protein [Bertelyvirus sp.]